MVVPVYIPTSNCISDPEFGGVTRLLCLIMVLICILIKANDVDGIASNVFVSHLYIFFNAFLCFLFVFLLGYLDFLVLTF